MRDKPARRRLLALLASVALVATGCGSSGGGSPGGPIVIGTSLPLTGQFSQPGGEAKRGYEIWRDMVNGSGGMLGRQIDLRVTDDAGNQDTIIADYTKLITQDKVDLLLGSFSSLLNYAASAVAERNRMLYVEPAGGAPNMFTRGFKMLFFTQPATAPHHADGITEWVKSLPADQKPATAAFLTQDDPFTRPAIESLQKQLEEAGVKTVHSTIYPANTTNFQPIGSAIAAQKPDLVAQGAQFEDGIGAIRAFRQIGFSPKIMFQTNAPGNGKQYSDGVGMPATEGVFYSTSWSETAKTPLNSEFVAEYRKRFNSPPTEDAADAFAAGQVLKAAVTGVGKIDQVALADWLRANEVPTILGPLRWAANGEPQTSFMLAQWQNGKVEVVSPKQAATTEKVVFPKPGWT
ncbi:branched-chain amino acid transport system substrate-binding protein [Kibdelosporangium banguiense]|uniref:Branched-chain amino acid transport system substrate-binding protein n=1 Tax=Kibdelosporangium banguiense TaxID=1365924 RepID=A0ABS4U0V3_9PSEU|nr:amino acid ABC transporter substrate-binding protein [Kibdelosporangium banguiense]MBP2330289.1 branched-chain amino acid transport system substrate-binding protein [Kibdelosporangium banguiense]